MQMFNVSTMCVHVQSIRWYQLKVWYKLFEHLRPIEKVSKGAKIRNRYNQVPHLTQDTNGKVTNSQLDTSNESQEVTLSQQVTTKHI